jgi:hypothetical protein
MGQQFNVSKAALLAGAGVLSVFMHAAQANGVTDLKASLASLQGQGNLKAVVDVKSVEHKLESKIVVESTGQATVAIETNAHGLHVVYGKETLALLENEERAKEKDPKRNTPTLKAINGLGTSTLRQLASASGHLSRAIENATFKSEKADTYNGKPARLLSFEMTIDRLDPGERKAVKSYEGTLDVWIGADGTPLASKSHEHKSIRVMMVISFEENSDTDQVYGVLGDRLVVLRKELRKSGEGMGEKGDSRTTTSLQIQS